MKVNTKLVNKWKKSFDKDTYFWDDYESQGMAYTCTMQEISSPYDEENLAHSILGAKLEGYKAIISNVVGSNRKARALLKKFGFVNTLNYMGGHGKRIYSYQADINGVKP